MSNLFEKRKNEEYIEQVMRAANDKGQWLWPDELALFDIQHLDGCSMLKPRTSHGYNSLKEIVTPKWFNRHVKQVAEAVPA